MWNFFFIPPRFTLRIGNAEDLLLFMMYFAVAIVNAVLTYRIRKAEKRANIDEEQARSIALYNNVLNTLSHELRTPISTIIGATDALKQEMPELTNDNKLELLHEIETAGIRLNRQVENLLNMSRLESGFLSPKRDWCDINELIYGMIRTHHDDLLRHKLLFSPNDELPLFYLDQGLIASALSNIVHNALQHTPETSTIEIKADAREGSCVITVTDDGQGLPSDQISAVFQKFYRLPHSKPGGTGLGLSIARGFVEAHQGVIALENISPTGLRVTITIPAEMTSLRAQED